MEKIVSEELVQKNIELFIRNRYEKEPAELIGEKEVEEKLQEIINTYKQEEAEDDPFASEKNNLLIYMTSRDFSTRNTINLFDVVHRSDIDDTRANGFFSSNDQ